MKKIFFPLALILAVSLTFFFFTACSSSKLNKKEGVNRETELQELTRLKKRVMVFPFIDTAGLGADVVNESVNRLVSILNESDDLVAFVNKVPMKCELEGADTLNPFGIICTSDLLEQGVKHGVNALLTGIVYMMDEGIKDVGIWPFDRNARRYNVSLVLNLVDVASGTLMLTRRECQDLDFPGDRGEPKRSELLDRVKNDALFPMIEDMAPEIKETIEKQPWTGKILSVDEEKGIKIDKGARSGVRKGMIFVVFAKGEKIIPKNGHIYFLIGKRLGNIRIVRVFENYSVAAPLGKARFEEGYFIRPFAASD